MSITPMVEIPRVRQHPGEPPRRWFHGEDMDLFVWQHDAHVVRLQLGYRAADGHERLFEWSAVDGARHHHVDEGARPGGHPQTAMLGASTPLDGNALAAGFVHRASGLPAALREEVLRHLRAWPGADIAADVMRDAAHESARSDHAIDLAPLLAVILPALLAGLALVALVRCAT